MYRGWCKSCQINYLKNNFTNWTSGNEEIDNFIQENRSKINDYCDIVFEWIPYNLICNIKETDENGFATVYMAMWKNGPLCYDFDKKKWIRVSADMEVALKCLYNSQSVTNVTNEFLNEVRNLYY